MLVAWRAKVRVVAFTKRTDGHFIYTKTIHYCHKNIFVHISESIQHSVPIHYSCVISGVTLSNVAA